MSQEGDGDAERALRSLHRALLLPFQRWRVQTSGVGTAMRSQQGYLELEDGTCAHLPDSWATATPDALEEEVCLFLLLWGEAANLRFMPELLFFLLELMRAYVPPPGTPPMGTTGFLDKVVRPVYKCLFAEAFEIGPDGKPVPHRDAWLSNVQRNYDDWNERFWTLPALFELRASDGHAVMGAPPDRRWALLLDANWEAFFSATPKTFRELRWWYCLLASNRRIFLAHALTFVLCFMAALPDTDAWRFNGWGAAMVVPFLLLLCPISRALGLSFDWWAIRSQEARRSAMRSYAILAVLVAACVINVYEQLRQPPSSVELRSYVPSLCVLSVGGLRALALEMLPQRPPTGTSLDDNLTFERRTAALLHEPWLTESRAPRHELVAVVRMYAFWAVVWTLKMALSTRVLLPTFFDSHEKVNAAFDTAAMYEAGLSWPLLLSPPDTIALVMTMGIWTSAALFMLADTYMWYLIVLSLVGGVTGLFKHGCGQVGSRQMMQMIKPRAIAKILTVDDATAASPRAFTTSSPLPTESPPPAGMGTCAEAAGRASLSRLRTPSADDDDGRFSTNTAMLPSIRETDSSSLASIEDSVSVPSLGKQMLASATDLHGERVEGLRYREWFLQPGSSVNLTEESSPPSEEPSSPVRELPALPALDEDGAWRRLRDALLNELYERDHISREEMEGLAASDLADPSLLPRNKEARRRLLYFARSLADRHLSAHLSSALASPGLTVLIPHYSETILMSEAEIIGTVSERIDTASAAPTKIQPDQIEPVNDPTSDNAGQAAAVKVSRAQALKGRVDDARDQAVALAKKAADTYKDSEYDDESLFSSPMAFIISYALPCVSPP